MPRKNSKPSAEAAEVMFNCSFELQSAAWLTQDGWQVFTPVLDQGHKTDLLVSDGKHYYPNQVKATEFVDEHVEVENKWKGSSFRIRCWPSRAWKRRPNRIEAQPNRRIE